MAASSKYQQLSKLVGEKKDAIKKLEKVSMQEQNRWDQLKTNEKLSAALIKHGMSMKPPRADQIVYMKSDGTPYPGMAVNRSRNRARNTALYKAGR